MKKLFLATLVASLFIATTALYASVPINKKHAGKKGPNGDAITCVYCHDAKKANNPKTKGNDLAALKKGTYCAGKGCH